MSDLIESNNFTLFLLILAVFRIYLEVINFQFERLPISSSLPPEQREKIHKYGFYFSLGYFILFAPEYLFYS